MQKTKKIAEILSEAGQNGNIKAETYKDVKRPQNGNLGGVNRYDFFIGIDPGVNTGFAIWNTATKSFDMIATTMIHRAMTIIAAYNAQHRIKVIVEDARKRVWFGDADSRQKRSGAGIREGVGSVKRDCSILEEFLTDNCIDFEMKHPIKGGTKLSAELFERSTNYDGRTSKHSRDAALLVYKRTN